MKKRLIIAAIFLVPSVIYADSIPAIISVNFANVSAPEYRTIEVEETTVLYTGWASSPYCYAAKSVELGPFEITKGTPAQFKLIIDPKALACQQQAGGYLGGNIMVSKVNGKPPASVCSIYIEQTPDNQYAGTVNINVNEKAFFCTSGSGKAKP